MSRRVIIYLSRNFIHGLALIIVYLNKHIYLSRNFIHGLADDSDYLFRPIYLSRNFIHGLANPNTTTTIYLP